MAFEQELQYISGTRSRPPRDLTVLDRCLWRIRPQHLSSLTCLLVTVDQAWLRIWNRTAAPATFQDLAIPPDPPPLAYTNRARAIADADGKFPCLVPSCHLGPYVTRQALSDHHNRTHRPGPSRYFCPHCAEGTYSYVAPFNLELHCSVTHSGIVPLACPVAACSYTARCPVSITCHCRRLHRGVSFAPSSSQPIPARRPRFTEVPRRLHSSQ